MKFINAGNPPVHDNNCRFDQTGGGEIMVVTTRLVKKGEQLFADYGNRYA